MKKLFSHWIVGALVWALVIALFIASTVGAVAGALTFIERADWKLIKSLITWLVWLQLLWSIGAWFRAKARKA